jgi:hypothetical protein
LKSRHLIGVKIAKERLLHQRPDIGGGRRIVGVAPLKRIVWHGAQTQIPNGIKRIGLGTQVTLQGDGVPVLREQL